MSQDHVVLHDLAGSVTPPETGVLSRTLHDDGGVRLVVFGFAAGEELAEHTSSKTALIEVLEGRLHLALGDTPYEVGPEDWVRMAPGLVHAVRADVPAVMLLTLIDPGA